MIRKLLFLLPGLLLLVACRNPFAPPLGDPISVWSDQQTVGGLLENFRQSYTRRDSLRYAECLSCPDYRFNYFDSELGDYSWMPREVDLTTTGRLFRHYQNVDLRWVGISEDLAAVATEDSLISFTVFFELSLDAEIITGHARFHVIRSLATGDACQSAFYDDEAVFRIQQWDDDL